MYHLHSYLDTLKWRKNFAEWPNENCTELEKVEEVVQRSLSRVSNSMEACNHLTMTADDSCVLKIGTNSTFDTWKVFDEKYLKNRRNMSIVLSNSEDIKFESNKFHGQTIWESFGF